MTTLNFRGSQYERSEFPLEGYEVRHEGTFLGNRYQIRSFHARQPERCVLLKYRGQPYIR